MAFLLFCFPEKSSFGGEVRDFTNKEGQTIRAEVLAISGSMIRIKRESDSLEFEIPIGTLSLDDQVWIKERIKASGQRAGEGEWTRLRIDLPTPGDRVRIVGNNSLILSTPVGANSYDLLLPVGAWVSLSVRCFDDPGQVLEHLVKFQGARHWKVSDESRILLVSRDSGPEKIVGISLPEEETEAYLRQIDRSRLDSYICVELPRNRTMDGVAGMGIPVSAITCDPALKAEEVSRIAEFSPKALDISVEEDAVGQLSEFGFLEALHLGVSARARVVDGEREQYAADRIVFTDFPDVRDLQLRSIPFTQELGELFVGMSGLRMLEFYWTSSNSMTLRNRPVWTGVERLASSLESLRPGPGIKLGRHELERLHGLRALTLHAGNLVTENDEVKFLPEDMQQLLALEESLLSSRHDKEAFAEWIRIGSFPELRRLHTYAPGDLEAVPNLEVLRATGRNEEAEETDLSGIASLSNLFALSLHNLKKGDIEMLPALPFAGNLEYLRLGYSELTDVAALARFPSLGYLETVESTGTFRSIELEDFPSLTMFAAYNESSLEEIRGLAENRMLRALRIRNCEQFANLGGPTPNSVFQSIEVVKCDRLRSLSALDATTGLTQVVVSECDRIEGPLRFLDRNPLRYLSIRNCELLDDRSIRDLPNYR